jgi:hypothetical protein
MDVEPELILDQGLKANSLRPCLLVWYFWGWEGEIPAHDQIPKVPGWAVYLSGLFHEFPGPSQIFPIQ